MPPLGPLATSATSLDRPGQRRAIADRQWQRRLNRAAASYACPARNVAGVFYGAGRSIVAIDHSRRILTRFCVIAGNVIVQAWRDIPRLTLQPDRFVNAPKMACCAGELVEVDFLALRELALKLFELCFDRAGALYERYLR